MNDALTLLKSWPSLQQAGAESLLASPAWRLTSRKGSSAVTLTRAEALPDDALVLSVTLDDEPCRLALVDSPAFPDLHRLWTHLHELPEALVLALVEKECGVLFTQIEALTQRLFAMKGLAASREGLTPFALRGEGVAFDFGLELHSTLVAALGRLENLDPAHPAVRALTRPARAVYGLLLVPEEELAALKPGDFVLLPENFGATAKWETREALDASEALTVAAAAETELSFAAFADEDFPPLPETAELELTRNGKTLFKATRTPVGCAAALKIL